MRSRDATQLLFNDGDLSTTFQNQEKEAAAEIEQYDRNKFLNTSVDDLCSYFEARFRVEPIVLHGDRISTDQNETQIDLSRDRSASFLFAGDGPRMVPATEVAFFVPFSGDSMLFRLRPSTYTLNPPRAEVRENELVFTFVSREPEGVALKGQFDQQLAMVRQYLSSGAASVQSFNESLRGAIRRSVDARRERLLKAANMTASLGYPMRRREGAPTTFVAPTVKRRIPIPPANTAPFKPEPVLAMEEYEHILSVMKNMALVLERSPSTFKNLDEEAIRPHFLVQLNGHYEGAATGETFNGAGKTDILIRQDGKNLFIGECKFWKGGVKLAETIDQLLSYTSWRDTKVALLLFVRDVTMSTVVEKVPEVLRGHASFKREAAVDGEACFRSIFGQPKDPSRELTITTLIFDVPH